MVLQLSKEKEEESFQGIVGSHTVGKLSAIKHIWRGSLKEYPRNYVRDYIVVEDYILYMDLIYNGTAD